MALPVEQIDLKNLSVNAKALLAQIDKGALVTDEDIVSTALGRVFNQIQGILLNNLRRAINTTKEFNTPELSGHLEIVFSNPDIIRVNSSDGRLNLFASASAVAGDWNDMEAGIIVARDTLGFKGTNTPEERSKYWKEIIYAPAREGAAAPEEVSRGKKQSFRSKAKDAYSRTIEARLDIWGELAPYWLILNYGNAEAPFSTGGEPYPNRPPTYFIEATEKAANVILRAAIQQVNQEAENVILQELEKFERKRVINLGEVIRRIFVAGQPYKIYITPRRGILGVRRG